MRICVDVATRATYCITQSPQAGCVTPIQLVDRGLWLRAHGAPCDVSRYEKALFGFLWDGDPLTTKRAVFLANEAMADWYQSQPGEYTDAVGNGQATPWYDFVKFTEEHFRDLGPATPMFVVIEQ